MNKLFADFLLLITAILWGSTFIFQRIATFHMEAFSFNAVRFLLASFAMFIALTLHRKYKKNKRVEKNATFRWTGIVGGFLLVLAINLQQYALAFTTVGKAGFLTGILLQFPSSEM